MSTTKSKKSPIKQMKKIYENEGMVDLLSRSGPFLKNNSKKLLYKHKFYYDLSYKYYRRFHEFDTDKYQAPLNPFKVIWVETNNINEMSQRHDTSPTIGLVESRDWDKTNQMYFYESISEGRKEWKKMNYKTRKFEDSIYFRGLLDHYSNGCPWEDTIYYQKAVEHIENGGIVFNGVSSVAELKKDCEYTDNLFESIQKNGYLCQDQIHNKSIYSLPQSEIRIDIGRDGQLLFLTGNHRFALAKILELDKIPVGVSCRHSNWMEQRDREYQKDTKCRHPDCHEFMYEDATYRKNIYEEIS